jgi:hypothetical protein
MQETLEQLLARLKAEIEDAEHGDVDRAELARLARAVETRLADTAAPKPDVADDDGDDDDDDSLSEELREGVVRWESSHPDLANFLHKAADTLGGIGI